MIYFGHLYFAKVADCLASPDLPAYDIVVQLDRQLRAVEVEAPNWLRWRESYDGSLTGADEETRERRIRQQHMACLLLHKALSGKWLPATSADNSPTSAMVQ